MASLAPATARPHSHPRVPVAALIAAAAGGASTALVFAANSIGDALRNQTGQTLAFLGATLLLQLFALRLPGRGSVGVSAVGIVAAAITLGTGPAMAISVCAALAQWLRSRGLAHRALYDAANFCLAAGAAGLVYHHVADLDHTGVVRFLAALLAGLAYTTVNHGLLCLAMGITESRPPLAVWQERFHWARYHFLAFGTLALLAATAYTELGAISLLAFLVPPLLLAQSMGERANRLAHRRQAAVG